MESQCHAQAAPLTVNQLLDISRVSQADISPDGKLAAFTAVQNRTLDEDAGGSWSHDGSYLFTVESEPQDEQEK